MNPDNPQPSSPFQTRRKTWRLFWRVLLALVILTVLLAVGFGFWFRSAALAALPQLDGAIATGVQAPVQLLRDAHGLPAIRAQSADDLFFAQGYVTAQDRLWQMDMLRRYAAGELSAALGSSTLKVDKTQRILGLRRVAEQAVAGLAPRDRQWFEAYARGVNAFIADHQYSLPVEFRVLRYFPRAWTPTDSFLVAGVMIEMLNHGTYQSKLSRELVLHKCGPEIAADLFPDDSPRYVAPGYDQPDNPSANLASVAASTGLPRENLIALPFLAAEEDALPLRPGSNNWVLSGAHTASGKPLLSNDMHLGHSLPNIWYEAHLTGGGFDVGGVSLPGLPGIIVGHNQRIAWGFTNFGPDVQDLYVESFNSQGQYRTLDGWKQPETRDEVIHVKRGSDVTIQVQTTRHGPIITPLINLLRRKGEPEEQRRLALRWTAYDPQAVAWVFFDVNLAQNWEQFQQAFSRFGSPGQNAVYADVDGNIGYHATGFVPIRAAGDGSVPVSGADNAHEWTGYIPFAQLPHTYNPPSGIIATANGKVTPPGYPRYITHEWMSPYRTERIYQLLHQEKKFTSADMLAIQTDIYSPLDFLMAQNLVSAVHHSPDASPSPRLRLAAELLSAFDGRMDKDSAAAAIVHAARLNLRKKLLEAKLGRDGAADYVWFNSALWLENMLTQQPARWLPPKYPDWDGLLVASLTEALKDAPRDLSSWRYGDTSTIEIGHSLFAVIPILRRWASTGVLPQSGDGETVKQVGRSFGPSQRMTVDFADFDRSTLNIVNGQSGVLFSPYFNDQWWYWYTGHTLPFPWSVEAVDRSTAHRLMLVPAR